MSQTSKSGGRFLNRPIGSWIFIAAAIALIIILFKM